MRTVVGILQAAKSRVIRHWVGLDSRITDAANEAKDNVKYLYTLDKYFGPLSKCDPGSMVEIIPSLMNSIRMIHSISQYYNTSERMTSLFVKVKLCSLFRHCETLLIVTTKYNMTALILHITANIQLKYPYSLVTNKVIVSKIYFLLNWHHARLTDCRNRQWLLVKKLAF